MWTLYDMKNMVVFCIIFFFCSVFTLMYATTFLILSFIVHFLCRLNSYFLGFSSHGMCSVAFGLFDHVRGFIRDHAWWHVSFLFCSLHCLWHSVRFNYQFISSLLRLLPLSSLSRAASCSQSVSVCLPVCLSLCLSVCPCRFVHRPSDMSSH